MSAADTTATPSTLDHARVDYLLCIEGDRSWPVRVPASGELLIGRSPEAGLVLTDALVSREHARLHRLPEGLRLVDLHSRHGTAVNGERLTGPRFVQSGDVITIGNSMLVVRRPTRPTRATATFNVASFEQRLAEELARAAQYQRELAVVVVRTDRADPALLVAAVTDRLRPIDASCQLDAVRVGIVLPELGPEEALGVATQLLEALREARLSVAIGVATCPENGADAATLLTGARLACDEASLGTVRSALEGARALTVGQSVIRVADPAMRRLYELAQRLARGTLPVLIEGETGVGKELAAASIHAFSPRAQGPFISVNCAAIAESLAESELFGHARGAFSGALSARVGHLETASGGTLFLDEIGELPLALQAKFLRVLESKEVMRVGETLARPIDVRFVAATNRDLEAEVAAGRFRQDLYFRLGAARLALPPLRDRPSELVPLATAFAERVCLETGRKPLPLSTAAAHALFVHEWPGNVRELRNAMHYAVTTAPDDAVEIEVWHLPPAVTGTRREVLATPAIAPAAAAAATVPSPIDRTAFRPIADEVRALERARMVQALLATGGVQIHAANLIEMPVRTFVTKLKRYRIAEAEWRQGGAVT